jgi:SAM-dependent methyltransferase
MFGDAEAYEHFMGRWSSVLAPQLVDFTGVPDSGKVLDVGSGTGALAFAIARLRPHCRVVGIDPSKEYVGYANSRNSFAERVRFEVGDAQRLRFGDATFDDSLSLLVFNFIPDKQRALSEISRVTKPGGRVSAAVWDYGSGMRMLRLFWESAIAVDPSARRFDESNMPLCRAGELKTLWEHGGLEHVEERQLDMVMQFGSFADYWEPFLLSQGPAGAYTAKLNPRHRETLRAEIKRRLAVTSENTPFALPARAWAARGVVSRHR